ncbi:hypothetical protein GCM10027421_09460 [Microbacterium shaanxiense]
MGDAMADDANMSLEKIAGELYVGPLDEFVSARDARAKATPDRDLAAGIGSLRKPSVAAWVVNVFARERSAQLGEALQLAEELREAQADLDAQALATLGRQRRALTSRLAQSAVELAKARGARVSATTSDAVRQTINAAFFDPDAAAAVASGRLIRELEPSGSGSFEPAELTGGGAAPSPQPVTAPVDEVSARRERRHAEQAVHDAERALAAAERRQAEAERALDEAGTRVERLTAQIDELETELALRREQADEARADIAEAEKARSAADEPVTAAQRGLDDARGALDRL